MGKQFIGYPREDGKVGIRNHVLIIPAQRQLGLIAKKISELVIDTKPFISLGELGRPKEDRLVLFRTMVGLALNPNTASVLIIGSSRDAGYDELKVDKIAGEIAKSGKRVEVLLLNEEDGFYNLLAKGIKVARDMVWEASKVVRETFDFKNLTIGVKCGMSDSTSGISGNPIVGKVFDKLVHAGGKAVFSETTEIIGAEHILLKRVKNQAVAQKLLKAAEKTEKMAKQVGEDIRKTNPIPENIAGGLTTLEEKSLGAIVKSRDLYNSGCNRLWRNYGTSGAIFYGCLDVVFVFAFRICCLRVVSFLCIKWVERVSQALNFLFQLLIAV